MELLLSPGKAHFDFFIGGADDEKEYTTWRPPQLGDRGPSRVGIKVRVPSAGNPETLLGEKPRYIAVHVLRGNYYARRPSREHGRETGALEIASLFGLSESVTFLVMRFLLFLKMAMFGWMFPVNWTITPTSYKYRTAAGLVREGEKVMETEVSPRPEFTRDHDLGSTI